MKKAKQRNRRLIAFQYERRRKTKDIETADEEKRMKSMMQTEQQTINKKSNSK